MRPTSTSTGPAPGRSGTSIRQEVGLLVAWDGEAILALGMPSSRNLPWASVLTLSAMVPIQFEPAKGGAADLDARQRLPGLRVLDNALDRPAGAAV
ncbi:MAG: hypothetical protein U0790_19355 [Isosphaeraceae bacterium]